MKVKITFIFAALICLPDCAKIKSPFENQNGSTVESKLVSEKTGIKVNTVKPNTNLFEESVEVVGVVIPGKLTSIHSVLEGRIANCQVNVGDLVSKGDVICTLDSTVAVLEQQRAKNAIGSTRRALDQDFLKKQKQLFEAGVIGQLDYEKLRVESERAMAMENEAEASLQLVQKKIEAHNIRAPFSGRIVELKGQTGLPVAPAIPLAILASTGILLLKSEVPANFFAQVNIGQEIKVQSVAGESIQKSCTDCNALITSKSNIIQTEKQTFTIESPISLTGVAPGILVRSKLILKKHEPSLTIPFGSVVEWDSKTRIGRVLTVDPISQKSILKEINTTLPNNDKVHVLSGLVAQDDVIFPLPGNLTGGVQVTPLREQNP